MDFAFFVCKDTEVFGHVDGSGHVLSDRVGWRGVGPRRLIVLDMDGDTIVLGTLAGALSAWLQCQR